MGATSVNVCLKNLFVDKDLEENVLTLRGMDKDKDEAHLLLLDFENPMISSVMWDCIERK